MATSIEALQDIARQKARQYDLPEDLFIRQITQESGWNPQAVGPPTRFGRAKGLGQFIDSTAADMGLTPQTVFDPEANLEASAKYMAQLRTKAGGDYGKAAAMYNFGPGNVLAGRPWPAETRNYVRAITGGTPPATAELRAIPSTLPPLPRAPSMQTAEPPSLRERFTSLFSTLNTGLPDPKAWVGEELPEPVEPTTGELLSGGYTMAQLMTGGTPILARLMPKVFGGLGHLALSMASSAAGRKSLGALGEELAGQEGRDIGETIGSQIGMGMGPGRIASSIVASKGLGALGEELGGQTGRDAGEMVGGMVSLPRMPSAIASRITGIPIPPVGPLKGTKVLTKEGLAKVVYHASPVEFKDYDPAYFKPGRFGLKGVWSTTQPQEASKTYSGGIQRQTAQQAIKTAEQELRTALKKHATGLQTSTLAEHFTPEEIATIRQAHNSGALYERGGGDFIEELSGTKTFPLKRVSDDMTPAQVEAVMLDNTKTMEQSEAYRPIQRREDALWKLHASQEAAQQARTKLADLKQQATVRGGSGVEGSAPHLRPQYLASQGLFDLDSVATPEDLLPIAKSVRAHATRLHASGDTQRAGKANAVVGILENAARSETPVKNSVLFANMQIRLGRDPAQQVIHDAGFDFTHTGAGASHRVYITEPDKVIPQFHPELVEAQATEARRIILQRQVRALRAENAMLERKQTGQSKPLSPAALAREERIRAQLEGVVPPEDFHTRELGYFTGTHPLIDKFIGNIRKAEADYQRTGILSPLLHPHNAEGGYEELLERLVAEVRAGRRITSNDFRSSLTPAAGRQAVGRPWDWKMDIE